MLLSSLPLLYLDDELVNDEPGPSSDVGDSQSFEAVPENKLLHVREGDSGPFNPPWLLECLLFVGLLLLLLRQHLFQILDGFLLFLVSWLGDLPLALGSRIRLSARRVFGFA